MSLTGHRQGRFIVAILDQDDRPKGPLTGVTGGSVQLSATTALRASGSLALEDIGQEIDWFSDRIKIRYESNAGSWDLGVFLPSAPTRSYTADGASWDVELLGKLAVLDQDRLASPLSVPQGTLVTEAVTELIIGAGEERYSIDASTARTTSTLSWDAGTSRLKVINELLAVINYWALTTDGAGVYQAAPYVLPAKRESQWHFKAGTDAIHSPKFDRDQDLAAIPNRVLLISQGGGQTPALTATASNEDPNSPYSHIRRGRWIVHTQTGVEATNQKTLNDLAQRKLIDLSTPSAKLTIEHLPLPLTPNAAVNFTSQGIDTRATISSITYSLDPTALCKTTLKEIVDL